MAYKDGFVIEYVDKPWSLNCYKCDHCNSDSRTCLKTGANLRREAKTRWRTCRLFQLADRYDTESMRARVEHARSVAQGKRQSKKRTEKKSKKKPAKAGQPKRQPVPIRPQKPPKKKLDGISEIFTIGAKVTSPEYGRGKVADVLGKWVTVVFADGGKRIRYDVVAAVAKGKLSI